MKAKFILLTLAALASQASADSSFYITGATAFRTAALKAICSKFSTTGLVAAYHNDNGSATTLTSAGKCVIKGNFTGISGVTTIYCTWSGSVEGIRDLALDRDVSFLSNVPTAAATNAAGGGADPGAGATFTTHKAQFAFSDVYKSATPYGSANLFPTNSNVGVVAFTWVSHESSASTLTNITAQSARAMFITGYQPLSLFTGNADDLSKYVFLTGRNDGSGTRTTFLAESGFAISRTLNQYKSDSNGTSLTKLQVWPVGDGANASTVWNPTAETPGNGGYSSGGNLTDVMKATSNNVTVYEADGTTVAFPAAQVSIIGYQSTADAKSSKDGGGRLLAYNGFSVTYDDVTGLISAATRAAISNGQYTLWGYEHLYSKTALTGEINTVYQAIKSGCNAENLGASGIPLNEMLVGRTTDGGVVAP